MRHFAAFDISRRLCDGILEPLHFYTRQRREIDVDEISARGHFAKAWKRDALHFSLHISTLV